MGTGSRLLGPATERELVRNTTLWKGADIPRPLYDPQKPRGAVYPGPYSRGALPEGDAARRVRECGPASPGLDWQGLGRCGLPGTTDRAWSVKCPLAPR